LDGDETVARLLPIQTQNKHRQTSMPGVGFEPMIPAFEQAKTVHALDNGATVTGYVYHTYFEISCGDISHEISLFRMPLWIEDGTENQRGDEQYQTALLR
jgi:hypothetical protein